MLFEWVKSNDCRRKTEVCFTLVSNTKTQLRQHDETVRKIKNQHYWSRLEAADKDYCLVARVFSCQFLNPRSGEMNAGCKQRKSRGKNSRIMMGRFTVEMVANLQAENWMHQ